ncbi:sugar transporter [Roseibium sp. TrichSKD4]|uniref:hypothetical protein n=1 Tax=Roseibium sp. TrichSKD4 TaxID=744980 RepID=UPI0001E577A0|nr:hypothetical protein [Roseibium sp. TrichSKD4]EFO29568.1 sugar transporter [Roseibium sp. TrichSKD4]
MLNRLFVVMFILTLFAAPIAGILSFAGGTQMSAKEVQQKTLCLTTGVSCGSGHIVLPALGRI